MVFGGSIMCIWLVYDIPREFAFFPVFFLCFLIFFKQNYVVKFCCCFFCVLAGLLLCRFGEYVCGFLGPYAYAFGLNMIPREFAFSPVFFLCFFIFFLAKLLSQMLLLFFLCFYRSVVVLV